jgi:DNA-directed RNA polymerase III subunit RPC8
MFVLTEISDTIKVDPHRFRDELKAIRASINSKYGDRILPNIGLCIALHSIISVGDAFIFPGSEGSAHFRVTFKMVHATLRTQHDTRPLRTQPC